MPRVWFGHILSQPRLSSFLQPVAPTSPFQSPTHPTMPMQLRKRKEPHDGALSPSERARKRVSKKKAKAKTLLEAAKEVRLGLRSSRAPSFSC